MLFLVGIRPCALPHPTTGVGVVLDACMHVQMSICAFILGAGRMEGRADGWGPEKASMLPASSTGNDKVAL